MSLRSISIAIVPLVFLFSTFITQSPAPTPQKPSVPAPSPTPKPDDQERIRIFTEEVVLPILAYDAYGRFDPTVNAEDVLVLEDGVTQKVTSARRMPVNVVLLIDMGSVLVYTQHLDVTRSIAQRVLSKLGSGDQSILIQFTDRAEVLQDWTNDTGRVFKALDPERGKLLTRNRSRLAEGLEATAKKLAGKEVGSTHLILITDGDDSPGTGYAAAVAELLHYQPTMHVLSYTTLAAQEAKKQEVPFLDRKMKRFYNEYDIAIKTSQQRLTAFAETIGGRIFLPVSVAEALKQGDEIVSEIGARCVLTYRPQQRSETADNTKPRRIEVFPRRPGLRVHALRSKVTRIPAAPN